MKLLNQNRKTLKNLLFCGLEIEIKKLRLNRYYLLLILIKLTCGHDVVSDYGEHFYHEGKCRLCGAFQPVTEEDFVFNLIEDGTAYEVGQSRFTGANLNILSTHNGLPVTRIGYGAFYAGYSLYSVVIPDSVTSIGGNAFYSCKNLASLTLGNGVTTIEYGAFFNCYRLTSITIPASLTTIGQYGFLDCISLVEIINNSELPLVEGSEDYGYLARYALHTYEEGGQSRLSYTDDRYTFYHDDNVSYLQGYWAKDTDLVLPSSFVAYEGTIVSQYIIYQSSFYYLTHISRVNIPSSGTSIEYRAFWNCIWITNVIMFNSVTFINYGAFGGTGIKNVYYGGTP